MVRLKKRCQCINLELLLTNCKYCAFDSNERKGRKLGQLNIILVFMNIDFSCTWFDVPAGLKAYRAHSTYR